MDWFTADWHLDHENIIKFCNRPFKNAEEMNNVIINNVNSVVLPNHRLYVLGDIANKQASGRLAQFRSRINCTSVYAVLGNHDKYEEIRKHFTVLPAQHMYKQDDYRLVLSHYAMRVWHHSHHGAGHLYGHSHGKLSPMVTNDGRGAMAFDVGVDCWDFKPLSLDQVKEVMKYRSSTPMTGKNNEIDDHHKPRS